MCVCVCGPHNFPGWCVVQLISKLSPDPGREGLRCLKTSAFTLHHLETATGFRFVLNTDTNAVDLRPNLKHIYRCEAVATCLCVLCARDSSEVECLCVWSCLP